MGNLADHENLKVFKQHGFIYKKENGDNVQGYSIFSGKNKFFINVKTKTWKCHISGLGGGFQKFLQEVHNFSLQHMDGIKLRRLHLNKGLSRVTIRHHKIGYNPENKTYLIPVWDQEMEKLWDLRIYNPKNNVIMSSAGCKTGLYGWESINEHKTVWLAEGEWDRMAMWQVLSSTDKLHTETVVSVPGVNTFKNEWSRLFLDKDVRVVYDNDHDKMIKGVKRVGASKVGSLKVFNLLKNIVSKLSFIHWPKEKKNGFDVRDFLLEIGDSINTYKALNKLLLKDPPVDKKAFLKETTVSVINYDGKYVPYEDVYDVYKKWLYLPNTDLLDLLYGTVIANRLDGVPVWMFIVGASGCGKSEILLSISESKGIKSTSSLTPHALVSGANYGDKTDPSFIPKWNGHTVIIKDWTTILDLPPNDRDQIYAVFRDIYDGKLERAFGNGVFRRFFSKFGIIAGVTGVIEIHAQGQTALGERFLRFPIQPPKTLSETMLYLTRAQQNSTAQQEMRTELQEMGRKVLAFDFKKIPSLGSSNEQKLLYLAQWTAQVRGTVSRDKYSKEILARPFIELGTRLIQEYVKLLYGCSMFKGIDPGEKEFGILKKVAQGSVPSDLSRILKYLMNNDPQKPHTDTELSEACGLPYQTARRKIEDIVFLGGLSRKKNKMKPNRFEYRVTKDMIKLIELSGVYS